jgi:hypothetical protein
MEGSIINEDGGIVVIESDEVFVTGNVTNHGVMRILNGAAIHVTGSFVNHGVLDIMTSPQTLPAGFINHGTILDSSLVRVDSALKDGETFTVTIHGFEGHGYRMEWAETPAGPWTPIGATQPGNGSPLEFTDTQAAANRRFYRIGVSP